MGDLIAQLMTPQVVSALFLCLAIIVLIYIVAIVWVARDAARRDMPVVPWTIAAVVPIVGLVAYCLLRKPLMREEQDLQDMELDLLTRQLGEYRDCPQCGRPVKAEFIICPHCHRQLRNVCTRCGRALEPDWTICPYCTTPVGNGPVRQRQ